MKRPPHITAAELRVMMVLWDLRSATVRQCLDALPDEGGEGPAYTTVMTLMNQLSEKGVLGVDRDRRPFIYTPVISKRQVQTHRVSQFLHSVFDGRAEDLVLQLVEEAQLSPADLRRIETTIRKRETSPTKKRSHKKRS